MQYENSHTILMQVNKLYYLLFWYSASVFISIWT